MMIVVWRVEMDDYYCGQIGNICKLMYLIQFLCVSFFERKTKTGDMTRKGVDYN